MGMAYGRIFLAKPYSMAPPMVTTPTASPPATTLPTKLLELVDCVLVDSGEINRVRADLEEVDRDEVNRARAARARVDHEGVD